MTPPTQHIGPPPCAAVPLEPPLDTLAAGDALAGLAPPFPPGSLGPPALHGPHAPRAPHAPQTTGSGSHPPVPDGVLLGLLFPALVLALLLLCASLLALR